MRVWGPAPFQNSVAMDWLGGLASGLQLADLSAALRLAQSMDDGDRAIARAAVRLLASAAGSAATEDLPETARRWLSRQGIVNAEPLLHEAMEAAKRLGDTELTGLLQSLPLNEVK